MEVSDMAVVAVFGVQVASVDDMFVLFVERRGDATALASSVESISKDVRVTGDKEISDAAVVTVFGAKLAGVDIFVLLVETRGLELDAAFPPPRFSTLLCS